MIKYASGRSLSKRLTSNAALGDRWASAVAIQGNGTLGNHVVVGKGDYLHIGVIWKFAFSLVLRYAPTL